jgi:hypothetical protein
MIENNIISAKKNVYTLIVLFVITFLCGFLKYTNFEFVEYIFFILLLVAGVKLIVMTSRIKSLGKISKGFLFLSGTSTIIFILLSIYGLFISMQTEINFSDSLESLEGLCYLTSLLFLIGVIGSIVVLHAQNGKK